MSVLTVRELIEVLEDMPPDAVVVVDGDEAEEAVLRDEIYFEDHFGYKEGLIVKIK